MSVNIDIAGRVLGNKIALAVLKYMFYNDKSMTGRELASVVGYSHQAVFTTLQTLTDSSLVESERAGRAILYRINRVHWFVDEVLRPLWEKSDGWISSLAAFYLERIHCEPLSIFLFGSYARGEATSDSDFDLLLVFDDDKITDKLVDDVLGLDSEIFKRYGVHPSAKVISIGELKRSSKDKKGFMRNAMLEAKTLFGMTPSEVLSHDS